MRFYSRRRTGHFFFSMLCICTLLLMLVALGSSMIVRRLLYQYEQSQFLLNYEMAITNLAETFRQRTVSNPALAGQLMENTDCHPLLCDLLEATDYDTLPPDKRNLLTGLLNGITTHHTEIDGFLLYATASQKLYYFTPDHASRPFSATLADPLTLTPFTSTAIDQEETARLIRLCRPEAAATRHYATSFTIFRKISTPLGFCIPLFSVREFDSIITGYRLDPSCNIEIRDKRGALLYSSLTRSDPAADESSVFSGEVTNMSEGFTISYHVPHSAMKHGPLADMLLFLALLVTGMAIMLSVVTYILSKRGIDHILNGMRQFGMDKLSYRIPKPQASNEFSQIIDRFNETCDVLEESVKRSYIFELQQKRSDLYALQNAINPHFLYNTLELIRSNIASGHNREAEEMILLLSRVYRSQTRTALFVTLDAEVELCDSLMLLYQYRFKNIDYEFDVAQCLAHYAIPRNTLQPLVENFIVHGVDPDRQDNLFLMRVRLENMEERSTCEADPGSPPPRICLTASNTGRPVSLDQLEELRQRLQNAVYDNHENRGFALTNIYSRMRIAFGEQCEMELSSGNDGMSFTVKLLFPARMVTEMTQLINEADQPFRTSSPRQLHNP